MAAQLRIAVVGKTGNGKSSVANSIIGKTVFKTGLSANRVTKVTSSRTNCLSSGQIIEVFDTPGLYQEDEDASEIRKEIEKSIVSPGLHAVVFVIKSGCFTKEEQEAVEQMKTLFGTSIFRFTIFAFTCINDLGTQPLEGFVNESAPVYLKDVMRRSGSRIVGFDNRDKTMDEESVKKIISLVADMSHTNKECLYSLELFEEAFQTNMKRKKEEQEKKEKERQLEFEEATAEKEAALKKKHEEDRNTIAEKQHQITSEQQQYWQETAEREKQSIEHENSESLVDMEEKENSGTNDLRDNMNLKTRVASDTQLEAKGPLLDSADLQHVKGENQPTKSGNDESFVAKGEEIASDMEASVTLNVAVRDVRDTEVHGSGLHSEEGRTGDMSETVLKEILERRTHNIQREQESYGIPPNELRLVIIGKSGNGKSSTGNTIIGKDIFETGATATSITKETNTYRASRFGKEILVVDTPGFFDPEIEIKETGNEISRCIYMTLPGFHAFLLVVRVGRFTAEEMNTVKEFEKKFGEKLYDFMIIVFTRTDDLFRERKTLDDFVRRDIPPNLKQIIERCNHRYVGLNNIDSPANKQKVTKHLLEMIETMIDSENPNHYTNEAFEKAEKDLRESIKARKEIKKAAKKAEFEEKYAEKEKKMREEHITILKEMNDVWDKKEKQQKENANKMVEEQRERMEASFIAERTAINEEETKAREALLEVSERAQKDIKDEYEKKIKGIQYDNAKKERLMDESKHRIELKKCETERVREGIARKEKEDKEMLAKSMADYDKRIIDLKTRFDNWRESKQKEHETHMEKKYELQERIIEEQGKRMTLEHELHISKEARFEETRIESKWFSFGKWAGFHK